nr:reverse transcriptase domain-containing protein [Tanacetum cinerariifolium]
MEEDFKPAVQHQRRVNPKIYDVIKNEVLKLLNPGLIYPISDSPWTRLVTGWRVCIDYRKLNEATRKDHFPIPFMDQMLERLAGNNYYVSSMVSRVISKFPSIRKIKKKPHSLVHMEHLPTATCLLGYAMHRARFKERMLKRYEDINLCLNWEKSHFMVKESIVVGHKISKNGTKVDKAKVDVIAKLPHPTTVKATVGNTQNVYAAGAYQDNSYQPQGNHNLLSYRSDDYLGPPGNTITNPEEEFKGITTRSGTAYQGPTIPTTSSSLPSVVEHETETLLKNKDKLSELARTPLNEHCSAVLLKKFLENLRDPGKFLISCDFSGMAECLALAYLGASINLMPLFVWKKLSLPDLSPTCMTLELADRLISCLVGVVEDVFVKVGTFHFLTDFIVVDFDADPRVPLILGRSFLKTERALIDVFKGELTLHVGKEAITFNLDQTSRYSANYNDITANRIDVIDMACEDDFLLEEVDAFLALEDDPTSPEAKSDKSSIDEPFKVELKDLPPHLKYAFLEGDDKMLVIITKDLSVEEKTALITILKSHNVVRAAMSPGGSIVASLENVNGFLAVYTPSDDLINTDFKQDGVVPEIMLHILKEFVFLLGRQSFDNEIPHMVVCEVSKP